MTARTTSGGSGGLIGQIRSIRYERRSCGSAATLRFSNTVESSNSSSDWNDRAKPARARFTADCFDRSRSSRSTQPSAAVNPLIASIREVLPAPFGPIRPMTVPGSTRKLTSFTATTAP